MRRFRLLLSMQKVIVIFILLLSYDIVRCQDVQQYYALAKEAYQKKDFEAYYSNLKEANRLHPYHQVILYRLGIAAALTNRTQESLDYLRKAILTDASFQLKDNPDLISIKNEKGFGELLQQQSQLSQPIINSDTAFVLKDRTLHTEGISYDAKQKTFYVGSIHQRKIIKVNFKGEVADFSSSGSEGMTSVFGLKADSKNNLLWVCSSPMQEMIRYDSTLRSAVFKFELSSGKLLRKFLVNANEPDGVFGDLVLNQKGEVFISDSKKNTIYKVNEKTGLLDPFYTSSEFWNLQGMTFSPDEQFLFISDYIKGIFRLTLSNKELIQITNATDTSLKGIDGIYFYKSTLITIQNGVVPARVARYSLNKAMSAVEQAKMIDRAHPAFNEPTLGVLADGYFYYIANSQWSGYKNGKQKPEAELQDIVILKAKLN